MDALVMCGGEGTRLDADGEKPLFAVDGDPMIDTVLAALAASRIDVVTAVTSPATPRTREYLDTGGPTATPVETIQAPGEGYVADLQYVLDRVDLPVLTVAADLPLLAGDAVDGVLDHYLTTDGDASLTVYVPASLKQALGASVDSTVAGRRRDLAPTGLNVVGSADGESTMVTWDARLAVNVNHPNDAAIAEALG